MGYRTPADVPISCSWRCHKDRNPPSSEPGTDYATAYGTDLRCAENGYVTDRKVDPGSATGRYVTVRLDDGRTVRYLHLESVRVSVGARVKRGQIIATTGASGYGSDWGYGAHVHVTLWPSVIWADPTIDFELYVGEDEPPPEEEEEDMSKMHGASYTRASDGELVRILFNEGSGWYSEVSGIQGDYVNEIASHWETNPWPTLTESHVSAIKRDLDKSSKNDAAAQAARWATPLAILVLAVVLIVVLL